MAKRFFTLFLMSLVMIGCAGASDYTPRPVEAGTTQTQMQKDSTTVIGYSVQHRPIELHRFGVGDRPVLVMATIHGDETGAATIGQQLINELQRNITANGVPLAVIPIANPDGYAARMRVNANHVDLNRNFPAGNWSTHGRSTRSNNFGGASAASEPETIALMQTIQQLKPRLIISIHSMEKPCNNYDGPAKEIAELMSKYNGFPATANIGYATPGSLGTWAGIDQHIPIITLELPRRDVDQMLWTSNRDAILAAAAMAK